MPTLNWIEKEIDGLKEQGLYNRIRTIGSAQGARLVVDGKDVLNFCSNNYLGLANHPKLVEAAKAATKKYGVGPAAVRSIAGTTDLHVELEKRLKRFKGAEDVITFQIRLYRQPGNDRGAGRQGGRDLLRPAEPRLDHRRLPALGRTDRGRTSTTTRPRWRRRSRRTPARTAGRCS